MNENEKMKKILDDIKQILTMQYDYPPNGMGSIGYKGNNMYRFKVEDINEINQTIQKRADTYMHSYNAEVMAQEIITDLLDEGVICYGGYAFKAQQKERHSI
ncbi:MAG: hypothetical protein IKG25_09840 [Mogibacterium sp.]|nr:hypothetical protein [Mogibacterium sp.]MBR2389786.1 hypothetical protein [Mogibacterium sp.]MBR3331480.1 hypothetical protein [Mogibacterium sp.]MBR4091867.1 hypothetical protein [Mogibacterium sp.]